MRLRHRCLRFVTFLSVTTMLVTPALASEERPAASPAAADDSVCIYPGGSGDTPGVGPLPCDASRPYMIERRGFGSCRAPSPSALHNSPVSPTRGGGSPPGEAPSASPAAAGWHAEPSDATPAA